MTGFRHWIRRSLFGTNSDKNFLFLNGINPKQERPRVQHLRLVFHVINGIYIDHHFYSKTTSISSHNPLQLAISPSMFLHFLRNHILKVSNFPRPHCTRPGNCPAGVSATTSPSRTFDEIPPLIPTIRPTLMDTKILINRVAIVAAELLPCYLWVGML